MQIKFRKHVAFGNTSRHSGKTGYEVSQRLVHLHDHARPARCDQGRISAELDRVAQALLAMKQDRLAVERVRAEPERL